ncbi:MAG: GGDEF domain-containing protein [Planctomycetes bacterium]|nr:GGDEF domain-containing protein [Planctomycetota bacterium]
MPDYRTEPDPLCELPSLFALTRGGPGKKAQGPARDDLASLLAIDPVLALRAIRMAGATILGKDELTVATPRLLLQRLGTGVISRMATAPAPAFANVDEVVALWLHAIASAAAARKLAELGCLATGVDPDLAAFCALVHDLPRWTTVLAKGRGIASGNEGPLAWSRRWRLPESLQVTWLAAHCGTPEADNHSELARTVVGAETLAILAGFPHTPGQTLETDWLASIDAASRQVLVSSVRLEVDRLIEDAGLEKNAIRECIGAMAASARPEVLPEFAEGIVKLQELGSSERYRPVLTSLVAGACRYLGADRAFFVQWVGKRQQLLIRTKYDRSAVPIGVRLVRPSPAEAALMGRVAGLEEPEFLVHEENYGYRLLDHLGSESVLVVPVLGGGGCHGLLLLDWSYSLRRSHAANLSMRALAIAGVCGQTMTALHLKRLGRRSALEARIDALTGLLNRRAALDQLEREIHRQRRKEQPMALMMLDLDHFKSTNDRYGHLTGDRVLASVGRVLKDTLRNSDVAGRYGGEEFLVVQFDTTIEEATVVAARIYKSVEEVGDEIGVPITISIGLTDLRSDDSVESLLRRADQALYASKHRGRNRFSIDSL